MENEIAQKMYSYYNSLLSESDCTDLAEDIMGIVEEEKYQKIIMEWLRDETNYSDIIVKDFSIVDIAKKLDSNHPNIPIAALLGYLAENESKEFQIILSISYEECLVDYKLIYDGIPCETAIFNDDKWFLFSKNTTSEDLKLCQMWQILVLNPTLAPHLAYKYENNTALCLQDNGTYLIVKDANLF